MNEKTAVEDLRGRFIGLSQFSLVVTALPCIRGLYGVRRLRACQAREVEIQAKWEPEPFFQGAT